MCGSKRFSKVSRTEVRVHKDELCNFADLAHASREQASDRQCLLTGTVKSCLNFQSCAGGEGVSADGSEETVAAADVEYMLPSAHIAFKTLAPRPTRCRASAAAAAQAEEDSLLSQGHDNQGNPVAAAARLVEALEVRLQLFCILLARDVVPIGIV